METKKNKWKRLKTKKQLIPYIPNNTFLNSTCYNNK